MCACACVHVIKSIKPKNCVVQIWNIKYICPQIYLGRVLVKTAQLEILFVLQFLALTSFLKIANSFVSNCLFSLILSI